MYFKTSFFDENSKPTEVELICNKCGKTIATTDIGNFDKITSDYCIVKENNTIKCECGNCCQSGFIQDKQNPEIKNVIKQSPPHLNIPHCPTCGSTNIKKISTTSKAVNTVAFGIFGTKRHKTFHCNNCGYEW